MSISGEVSPVSSYTEQKVSEQAASGIWFKMCLLANCMSFPSYLLTLIEFIEKLGGVCFNGVLATSLLHNWFTKVFPLLFNWIWTFGCLRGKKDGVAAADHCQLCRRFHRGSTLDWGKLFTFICLFYFIFFGLYLLQRLFPVWKTLKVVPTSHLTTPWRQEMFHNCLWQPCTITCPLFSYFRLKLTVSSWCS